MRFGVYVPTFGEYDVDTLARLAQGAEAAGWDGFFIWDHLAWTPNEGQDLADTTVALTAIAACDREGALWCTRHAARAAPALEAGQGDGDARPPLRWTTRGRCRARRARRHVSLRRRRFAGAARGAARRRPGSATALWGGQPVRHAGECFHVHDAVLRPTPLQHPRIPIWIAGLWPNRPPFRRAARFDGALPLTRGHLMKELSPSELRECRDYISAHRAPSEPYDLVAHAASQPRTPQTLAEYEQAGATWWVEAVDPLAESLADFRNRIDRGP